MSDKIQVVRVRSVHESKDDTAIVVFEAVGGVDSEPYHSTVRVPVGDVIELTEERRSNSYNEAMEMDPPRHHVRRRLMSEWEAADE